MQGIITRRVRVVPDTPLHTLQLDWSRSMSEHKLRLFPLPVWQKIRARYPSAPLRVCPWCKHVYRAKGRSQAGCSDACSLAIRFEMHVLRTEMCWIWQGTLDKNGYGVLSVGASNALYVHRYAYERFVGPIPHGLTLDHLCRTPACCNPAHLEAVTYKTNTLRGEGVSAENARKTHCLHGHLLTGENLYIAVSGARVCKACRRRRKREYEQRQKAKRLEVSNGQA